MALKLPETTLKQIRDGLKAVGDELDASIVNQNLQLETKEEKREQVLKENVIDKARTDLKQDEKTRFLSISKIFVKEWIDQVKKFQKEQEKRKKLVGEIPNVRKKSKVPYEFLTNLLSKRKKKLPNLEKPKKGTEWVKKIMKYVGLLALGWVMFKSVIKKIPDSVWKEIKGIGSSMVDGVLDALGSLWDEFLKDMKLLWEWIKEQLHLKAIGNFFRSIFNTFSGWMDSIWLKIKGAWNSVVDFIVSAPGKIWDWICSLADMIFSPIIRGIKAAWDWMIDKVLDFWNWITDSFTQFWKGVKTIWKTIKDFFVGLWDSISFESIWNAIKNFVSGYIADLKEDLKLLFTGHIKELAEKYITRYTGLLSSLIDKIKSIFGWDSDENEEKVEKTQVKTEVKTDVKKVIEKQEEIVLKDDILESVKDICDRINVFFSGNKDGFIDLSNRLIEQCDKGFKSLFDQFQKIKLENIYNVEQDVTYRDNYDQSDHSTKIINNDYSKSSNDDYSITYNSIDIPAVNDALGTIQRQSDSEIKLLESQNDYLLKMIVNIDGLGEKLSWLDPKKLKNQEKNTIIPIVGINKKPLVTSYQTYDLKRAQINFAKALG